MIWLRRESSAGDSEQMKEMKKQMKMMQKQLQMQMQFMQNQSQIQQQAQPPSAPAAPAARRPAKRSMSVSGGSALLAAPDGMLAPASEMREMSFEEKQQLSAGINRLTSNNLSKVRPGSPPPLAASLEESRPSVVGGAEHPPSR